MIGVYSAREIHTVVKKRLRSETLDAPSGEFDSFEYGDACCRVRIG